MPRLLDLVNGGEIRMDTSLSYEFTGGDGFSTDVVISRSGKEQRTRNWLNSRREYEISYSARLPSVWKPLRSFFKNCFGKYYDFRMKDWMDFSADFTEGVVGQGVGTGLPTSQLGKLYYSYGASVVQPVYKPTQDGSLQIKRNGTLMLEGSSTDRWEVDLSQGIITFTASISKNISAISKAASGVVTAAGHTFTNGTLIYLSGVGGMVEINGLLATVAGATTDTFATGIDTTDFTTYTSGGTAKKFPQPSDVLTASFEYDIPVRFDIDKMQGKIVGKTPGGEFIYDWNAIPIVEVRTR